MREFSLMTAPGECHCLCPDPEPESSWLGQTPDKQWLGVRRKEQIDMRGGRRNGIDIRKHQGPKTHPFRQTGLSSPSQPPPPPLKKEGPIEWLCGHGFGKKELLPCREARNRPPIQFVAGKLCYRRLSFNSSDNEKSRKARV